MEGTELVIKLITELRHDMNARFERIDERFERFERRIEERMGERLGRFEQRFEQRLMELQTSLSRDSEIEELKRRTP